MSHSWIAPERLTVVQLKDAQDVEMLIEDVWSIVEGYMDRAQLEYFLYSHPQRFFVYYLEDTPVLGFERNLFKKSAEIHGVLNPRYRHLGVPYYAALQQFEDIFRRRKQYLIAKVPKGNTGALGFCRIWGFKHSHSERGTQVYKLTKEQYERTKERLNLCHLAEAVTLPQ